MSTDTKHPPRKRRSESFIGIHFDFHAGNDCTEIGRDVTPEMVENIIHEVHPDFIQCDCKGHRGLSSYPTKVGYPAPGFIGDPLRIWREVTARHGVALYMHYSGVWDSEAVQRNPSWARIDENGSTDPKITSVFGPYVDELMIPQLKELCDEYGVDGVWVDGECWAACRDYSDKAIEAFRRETGIETVPHGPDDPFFFEFNQFCREGFRRYLRRYVDALHQHNPDFQIASNWAYTSFMPEPINADVDYISGDYTLQDSVNSARLQARCMARQGKPWDLMAWGFSSRYGESGRSTKSALQLQQEAAIVLSLGGGFQTYCKQKRDGSINQWEMKVMGEVARFCRARQDLCHRAELVPQIGLLFSTEGFYRQNNQLFATWDGQLTPLKGVLQNLLESQNVVEVVMDHHLEDRIVDYPLIVVPEWKHIASDLRHGLLSYVENGGSLLLVGPWSARLFESELRVRLIGEVDESAVQWLEYEGTLCGMKTPSQRVELLDGSTAIGGLYRQNDIVGSSDVAASVASYGRGKIAATYLNLGERYLNGATSLSRRFLNGLVRRLFPDPVVEVSGSQYVDVTVTRLDGRLAVNLVNTSGPHANENVYIYDEIPSIGPLQVVIRAGLRPQSVTLEPSGHRLDFQYDNGTINVQVPKVDVHEVIVVR